MNAILTIAGASVTEHVRHKLVIFFLGLALVGGAGLIYVSLDDDLTRTLIGQTVGVASAFSVSVLPALALFAAIALSMNNIGRPFADGEAMLYLARPVTKWQYALGRILASVALIAGFCLVIALIVQAVSAVEGGDPALLIWGHWGTEAFNLTLLVAITTLMSAVIKTPILAAIVGFFAYGSTEWISTLYLFVTTGSIGGAPGAIANVLWYVSPKRLVSPLDLQQMADAGNLVGSSTAMLIPSPAVRAAWAIGYLLLIVALTLLATERKEV